MTFGVHHIYTGFYIYSPKRNTYKPVSELVCRNNKINKSFDFFLTREVEAWNLSFLSRNKIAIQK